MNEKIITFLTAIANVFRSEENQEPVAQLKIGENATEDFTALLIAMKMFFQEVTGSDTDIIDFTHLLNKLAVQYVLGESENG